MSIIWRAQLKSLPSAGRPNYVQAQEINQWEDIRTPLSLMGAGRTKDELRIALVRRRELSTSIESDKYLVVFWPQIALWPPRDGASTPLFLFSPTTDIRLPKDDFDAINVNLARIVL